MMEVWLRDDDSDVVGSSLPPGVDKRLGNDWYTIEGKLYDNNRVLRGAHIEIENEASQQAARALLGSVEWLLLEFPEDSWSLIPLENLIAACSPPTRIAAIIRSEMEAQGVGFALEIGVDALVANRQFLEAALVVKSMRGEKEVKKKRSCRNGYCTYRFKSIKNYRCY